MSEWGNPIRKDYRCFPAAGRTQGSEPSQYLKEEKTIVIPSVAASERGRAQTAQVTSYQVARIQAAGLVFLPLMPCHLDGVVGPSIKSGTVNRSVMEKRTRKGDSPVGENHERTGLVS